MTKNTTPTKFAGASRGTLLLALLIGLAAGIMTAVLLATLPSGPAPTMQTTGKALVGGPFSLLDASGKRVTEKDFAGRPLLVYFGFTNCPDVCPAGLQVIAAALDRLGDKAGDVGVVFITVDPERDTPELVGKYAASFHKHILGLSGSSDDIAAVTKAYRVYAKKVPDEERPGDYSVDHSTFMYLMDGNGEYTRHFPHSVDAAELAGALTQAIEGSAGGPAS
ncbi:SCO family protein [Hyphomicrobium sp.]|uniref:SCO family protein n=1 Tax=Hyphomicrobium sp. TaxID=82 RepID=UPI0025BDDCB8|nr:SCO family protein [Hyphomicrobium sp.]MCC7252786.1 SCO family protein [Hyphomicrobium sp.]